MPSESIGWPWCVNFETIGRGGTVCIKQSFGWSADVDLESSGDRIPI